MQRKISSSDFTATLVSLPSAAASQDFIQQIDPTRVRLTFELVSMGVKKANIRFLLLM